MSNFQQDVIDRSFETAVVVDFWAPWCGPCRVLGPVLEKLAAEAGARWSLAKVNTDENPEVSMQYGIRGIPAVKLFVDGEVVDEFTGALPEFQVRQWLAAAVPDEDRLRIDQAEAAIEAGDPATAEALLRKVLDHDPAHATARLLLARIRVFRDADAALELLEGIAVEPRYLHLAEAIQTVAGLATRSEAAADLPDDPVRPVYLGAAAAVGEGNLDQALDGFIRVIQQNRYYDDDGSRKACVALFTLLGPSHPLTRKHRRTFDMWLY